MTLGVVAGAALVVPGMIAAPAAVAAGVPAPTPAQGTTIAAPTPVPTTSAAVKSGAAVTPQTAPTPTPAKLAPVAAPVASIKAAASNPLPSSLSSSVTDPLTDRSTTKTVTSTVDAYMPSLSPTVSAVANNDKIIVNGTGFVPNSQVVVTASPSFPGTVVTSDASGALTASIPVDGGTWLQVGVTVTITATGVYNTFASTTVTIIDNVHPNAKLDPIAPAEQIAPIVVTGSGFRPNAQVSLFMDDVRKETIYTDADGKLAVDIGTSRDTPVGDHSIKAYAGSSVLSATATVTGYVFHPVTFAQAEVQQGEPFTITVSDYRPGEMVTVDMNRAVIATQFVGPDGMFAFTPWMPFNAPTGPRTITATSEDGKRVSSTVITVVPRVTPVITVTPVVTAGGYVRLTGSGFDPDALLVITIPNVGVFRTMAERDGTFGTHNSENAYRVNSPGTYTLTLRTTNGDVIQATFIVESAVPIIPVYPPVTSEPVSPAPVQPVAVVTPKPLAFTSLTPATRTEADSAVVAPFEVPKVPDQTLTGPTPARATPMPTVTPKPDHAAVVAADVSKVSDDINWVPYVFGGILILVAAGVGVLGTARGRRAGNSR
ncbi:hypothetical protein [Arthrobacter sp. efr-133-TYG-120]|uniref:hypothetical protein n=1 Tax=Arthrobacter sp. efr-133-TYG-120 TaxID=3040280 RepID=UPI00254ECE7D|nr:hypothetical protein [Arthrobacter sp. efr-133-TYG-120]